MEPHPIRGIFYFDLGAAIAYHQAIKFLWLFEWRIAK